MLFSKSIGWQKLILLRNVINLNLRYYFIFNFIYFAVYIHGKAANKCHRTILNFLKMEHKILQMFLRVFICWLYVNDVKIMTFIPPIRYNNTNT